MRTIPALLLAGAAALAQGVATQPAPQKAAIATQLDSVQKQREAVRKQVSTAASVPSNAFFTAPWTFAMTTPPGSALQAECDAMADADVTSLVDKAAGREGVDPKLVRAVIRQESGFRPCAISAKGAQGLMQLMPETAQRFHVADPFDPAQNVDGGTKFLKELLAKYAGDLRLALGAYNAGVERVKEAGAVPEIGETQDYVTAILKDLGVAPAPKTAAAPANPGST